MTRLAPLLVVPLSLVAAACSSDGAAGDAGSEETGGGIDFAGVDPGPGPTPEPDSGGPGDVAPAPVPDPEDASPAPETVSPDPEPSEDGASDALGPPDLPKPDAKCEPDCAGRVCGPDGCGSICGYCVHPQVCDEDGQCVEVCIKQCDGKKCGPDGCGGVCGVCEGELLCGEADGLCYEPDCEPKCDGKVCGPNGCGGTCGDCAEPKVCVNGGCALGPCGLVSASGECQGNVAVWCEEKVKLKEQDCDDVPNQACKYDGFLGRFTCQDKGDCIPQCAGKKCGSDGCGGICPPGCPTGWSCPGGACAPEKGASCGGIDEVGECAEEGKKLWFCANDVLYEEDCTLIGAKCGWDSSKMSFECK